MCPFACLRGAYGVLIGLDCGVSPPFRICQAVAWLIFGRVDLQPYSKNQGAGEGEGRGRDFILFYFYFGPEILSCVGHTGERSLSRHSYISTREVVHGVWCFVLS